MATRPEELSSFDPYLQLRGITSTDEVFLKIEHLNVPGSVKMKAARCLIGDAEKRHGDLSGKLIVESSSGNLGIAVAMICASRGYQFRCVVDPNANRNAISEICAYCADVFEVSVRDDHGGFLGTRIAEIRDWVANDPNVVWLNQYENVSNPIAHMALTGPELASAFHHIDYLFIGVGTGGTVRGVVDYFKHRCPHRYTSGNREFGQRPTAWVSRTQCRRSNTRLHRWPPAEGQSYYNHYIPSPEVASRAHRELDSVFTEIIAEWVENSTAGEAR